MCEYIKTKDGIMNAATVRSVAMVCGIDKETIVKEADALEELCDKFIVDAEGYIYTREVMLLSDSLRSRCERWIKWANDNPDRCRIF